MLLTKEGEYLTLAEACEELRLSSTTVHTLATTGKLPYVATPYGRLYHVEDVAALKAEREANPPRPGRKKGRLA